MENINNPPSSTWRVKSNDPAVIREAAKAICERMQVEVLDYDTDESFKALCEALKEGEGYAAAKLLDDDYGWEITADDVETLESALSDCIGIAYRKTQENIKNLGLKPRFKAGDKVAWKAGTEFRHGVIASVVAGDMTYHIPWLDPRTNRTIEYFIEDERLGKDG